MGHIFVKYVKKTSFLVQKQFNNIHFPILFRTTLYEGSAIYIFLIALEIFGHFLLSKSLPHDKIQLHLPNKCSSANFQSFCPPRSIVKEVPFLYIQMTWNLYSSFICQNYHPPTNCSSVKSSMWAQVQFIFYGQIGTLQSKCYLDPSYYPQNFWPLFHTQIIATW